MHNLQGNAGRVRFNALSLKTTHVCYLKKHHVVPSRYYYVTTDMAVSKKLISKTWSK